MGFEEDENSTMVMRIRDRARQGRAGQGRAGQGRARYVCTVYVRISM